MRILFTKWDLSIPPSFTDTKEMIHFIKPQCKRRGRKKKQKGIWHYLNIPRKSFKMVEIIKRCVNSSVSQYVWLMQEAGRSYSPVLLTKLSHC